MILIFLILLLVPLVMVVGPTTSYTATSNKMFVESHQINDTFVYYQHKVVVNRVIQIPCYLESSNLSLSPTDSTSYEWLMNGRQIRPHAPFIYGTWDVDGILTILAVMVRLTTIWCHARVEHAIEIQDFYFAHQIQFYEEPVYQTVISVLITLYMPKDSLERKCKYEKYTCDCRTETEPNATEIFQFGLKEHIIRDILNDLALETCNQEKTCLSVSLDNFQCVNDHTKIQSIHHTTFSFFLYSERNYSHFSQWSPSSDAHDRKTLSKNFETRVRKTSKEIISYMERYYYSINTKFELFIDVAHFEYCMGVSGRLDNSAKECQLCPAGTFAQKRIINPPPPVPRSQYHELLSDQPHLIDKNAVESDASYWLSQENEVVCLPCPTNTYTEELGRIICLPCPVWHMTPEDHEGRKMVPTGSEWLTEACPREGRAEFRLVQVSKSMLGTRFSRWVRAASPITRVGTLVALTLIPLCLAIILLFIAYIVIDVGATMVKMANRMHPLQVQIAETTTATAQFKAEQRQIAAEAYARMKAK